MCFNNLPANIKTKALPGDLATVFCPIILIKDERDICPGNTDTAVPYLYQ
jgi:hypothetical protein